MTIQRITGPIGSARASNTPETERRPPKYPVRPAGGGKRQAALLRRYFSLSALLTPPKGRADYAIISTTTEAISTKKLVATVAAQQRSNVSIEITLSQWAFYQAKLALSVRNVNRGVA
jgi:hypothetical protein